jgi:hypothetical protein
MRASLLGTAKTDARCRTLKWAPCKLGMLLLS